MSTKSDYKPESQATDYAKVTLQEFLRKNNKEVSHFTQTKLALACEGLVESGWSYGQIAKKIGLASSDAVFMLIHHYGKNGKKRGAK